MTYAYPINVTGFLDFVTYENGILNGALGYGIIILVWAIVFTTLKVFDAGKAFVAAFFVTMIFSMFMFVAGVVGIDAVIILIILTAISIVYDYWIGD